MHHDILTIVVSTVTAISARCIDGMDVRTNVQNVWFVGCFSDCPCFVICHVGLQLCILRLDFLQPKWHCCCGFSLQATDGRFYCCKWQRSPRRLGSILVECCSDVHTNLLLKSYYTHLLFAGLFSHTQMVKSFSYEWADSTRKRPMNADVEVEVIYGLEQRSDVATYEVRSS